MERAIAEMEKIRRAEEIYAKRKNNKEDSLGESKNIYKFLFQAILLINIVVTILAIQNRNYIFTESFINQVNSYNINVKEKAQSWFNNNVEKQ